jgi:hypothetical protein
MLTDTQSAQLKKAGILQTAEILLFFSETFAAYKDAKSDDNKVSLPEIGLAAWKLKKDASQAFDGYKELLGELKGIGPAAVEMLADIVFPNFKESPSHTRDRVNAYIGLIREAVNVYRIEVDPPKARVVE